MATATTLENKHSNNSHLPGPKGLTLWRWGLQLPKHPLKTYTELMASYGDLVYCPWTNRETLFIFHPDGIKHILRDHHTNYLKGRDYAHMKPLLGDGLLLSEGELWRQQRQIMAKEFHHQRVDSYVPVIEEQALKLVEQWKNSNELDVMSYLTETTFVIASRVFFGAVPEGKGPMVRESLDSETVRVNRRIRRLANFPRYFPTLENIRGEKAIWNLKTIVEDILLHASDKEENVLSRLKRYRSPEGRPLPAQLIRDEVMTLMLAGHETTSNLLAWTLMLLSQHSKQQAEARQDRTNHNLKNCILESMRLLPPAPMVSRTAKEADTILGYDIEAGTNVLAAQWVTHRDQRFWPQADQFRPERFDQPLNHEYSYFPFARGPRSCIGEEMAMRESLIILRTLLDHFQFAAAPGFEAEPVHHVTLRPKNGLRLKLTDL